MYPNFRVCHNETMNAFYTILTFHFKLHILYTCNQLEVMKIISSVRMWVFSREKANLTEGKFFRNIKSANILREYVLKAFINELLVVHTWFFVIC